MQQNQARAGLPRLSHGKGHQPVQVAQIRGDKDNGWMCPATTAGIGATGIGHNAYLNGERVPSKQKRGCATAHP